VKTLVSLALVAMTLTLGVPSRAGDDKPSPRHNTIPFDPAKGSPKATLADASWLVGRWVGAGPDDQNEEVWLAPQAGSILSTSRAVKSNRVEFYELTTITEENGSLVMNIKLFNADLKGWQEKDVVLRCPLVKVTPTDLYFDNLTYRKISDPEMEGYVLLHKKSGEDYEERFPHQRAGNE